ncbi:NAD(P)-dependent oxidoreductase [Conexibacter sp. CPCC 206217]|uniref:NAD(P)-dependent oxidoreductase n=1 Tax=Conexibacter sp. CPCC 206217 TaxID=3064574 RepID=UPI00271954F5|nr:NAD(P)H-binding protein [Conexibacter sp. CPCC 206217]MDO8208991.1 NAD(P)H-binding protein [Conexibacter sp. CPCC 206217]
MKIVVFGAGFVGGAIARELAARGHDVTAVSRSGSADMPEPVRSVAGSVGEPAFVRSVTSGADVVVSALPARADGASLAAGVTTLMHAAEASGARLGVVGGASVIPVFEGQPAQGDTPEFPERFAALHHAHQETLDTLRLAPADVDWFYLIPAGEFGAYNPGTRTGRYRKSTVAQVTNAEGRSLLGVDDYAIGFADEVEAPHTRRAWLAIGY